MKRIAMLAVGLGLLFVFGFLSAGRAGTPELSKYSRVAWDFLGKLCSFGPRNPGSPGHARAMMLIKKVGFKYADAVKEHRFIFLHKGKERVPMANLELQFRGREGGRPILVGAHYDTRPYADEEVDPSLHATPILGANDGGSGTAVLLALAQYLHEHKPKRPVHLVFFDGEDFGAKGAGEMLIGSTHYARSLGKQKKDTWPYCVIVVDMVGDKNLKIYNEASSLKSAPWLMEIIHGVAKKRNISQFQNKSKYSIFDDHSPFIGLQIPSVLLIDFDYPHWHKVSDRLDKCLPESLFAVFSVLAEALGEI